MRRRGDSSGSSGNILKFRACLAGAVAGHGLLRAGALTALLLYLAPAFAKDAGVTLVPFASAPFPVPPDSIVPDTGQRFFDNDAGGRFHVSPRGGKLYEHPTYDDRRSLVVVPSRFDPARPAALVLFFHGNRATLTRDVVGRQKVVAQFERSGLNAILLAPQLAVDALDSSPGRFYERGFLDAYLREAADHAAARARLTAEAIDRLPLILVAYSGGYLATAYSLPAQSGTARRILGVVLLDALFGEEAKFARWIAGSRDQAFVVSAFTAASAPLDASLARALSAAGIAATTELPPRLHPGDVVLRPVLGADHDSFVTQAWVRDPLQALLRAVELDAPSKP